MTLTRTLVRGARRGATLAVLAGSLLAAGGAAALDNVR